MDVQILKDDGIVKIFGDTMSREIKVISEEVQEQIRGITFLVLGIISVLVSGYLLFFKLDIFSAPRLFFYFPKAYLFLFSCFLVGVGSIIWGIITLKKNKKSEKSTGT